MEQKKCFATPVVYSLSLFLSFFGEVVVKEKETKAAWMISRRRRAVAG